MKGVGRSRQIYGRTHGGYRRELRRAFAAPFACEFQHEVAAHRKSNQGKAREFLLRDQGPRHFANVVRPSGMIERGREQIGRASCRERVKSSVVDGLIKSKN